MQLLCVQFLRTLHTILHSNCTLLLLCLIFFSLFFTDDFSRVRLISMNEEEGADYINANYIPVSKKKKKNSLNQASKNRQTNKIRHPNSTPARGRLLQLQRGVEQFNRESFFTKQFNYKEQFPLFHFRIKNGREGREPRE